MAKIVRGQSTSSYKDAVESGLGTNRHVESDKELSRKLSDAEQVKLDDWKKRQSLLDQAFDEVSTKYESAKIKNIGKSTSYSGKIAELDKYKTFGSDIFGTVGFNPFDDNASNFKAIAKPSDDLRRAFVGFSKLAGIADADTFAGGIFAEHDNYVNFMNINNAYSPIYTDGGGAFFNNLLLSSGYSLGVITGILKEELLLTGAVALGRGAGASAALARTSLNVERGASKISKAWKLAAQNNKFFRAADHLTDISKARTLMGKVGRNMFHGINPIANTVDFVRDIDKIKDINGLARVAVGAGALVRDARKITTAFSESKLEANLAKQEYVKSKINDWHKANPGMVLPESKLNEFSEKGDKVYSSTLKSNFGLIYATNGISFDNMFTNGNSLNRMFNLNKVGKSGFKVTARNSKYALSKLKAFGGAGKAAAKEYWAEAGISALSEGFQELGQDFISSTSKYYYDRDQAGLETEGAAYTNLLNDMNRAYTNMFYETEDNKEEGGPHGLDTFLSGALMGIFMGPAQTINEMVMDGVNGGYKTAFNSVFNRSKYKEEKKNRFKELEAQAELLNNLIKNDTEFLTNLTKPVYHQKDIQEKIFKAVAEGDTKTLNDLQEEAFAIQLETMFKHDIQDELTDHLRTMARKATPAELNQAFSRTDITESNDKEFRDKLLAKADRIDEYKKRYDEIENTMINPIEYSEAHNTKLKNHRANAIAYHAYESLKRDMLFSNIKIGEIAERIKNVRKNLEKSLNITGFEADSLIDQNMLSQRIQLLETQIKASKGIEFSAETKYEEKKKLERAEQELEKLKAFKEISDKVSKEGFGEYNEESYQEMFDAYTDLLKVKSLENNLTDTEVNAIAMRTFDDIYDLIKLKNDHSHFTKQAQVLADPSFSNRYINETEKVFTKILDNRKEHIANSLKAFETKKEGYDVLQRLAEKGIFMNMQEFDEMFKNRFKGAVMPSEFYDIETQKPASKKQVKEAQQILNTFYKNLTGKAITEYSTSKATQRAESDKRTINDLLKQYGIELNKAVDLSTSEGEKFLNKILRNKDLTNTERELLRAVAESNSKLIFTDDVEAPVTKVGDAVYVDIRYAAAEYKDAKVSFESLVIAAMIQDKIAVNIESNPELKATAERMMEQVKAYYTKAFPTDNVSNITMFNSVPDFLLEVLNNKQLQNALNQIKDDVSSSRKSLWSNMMIMIKSSLKNVITTGTLLDRGINIAAQALDIPGSTGITIEEPAQTKKEKKKVKTSAKAKAKVEKRKLKNLEKIGNRLAAQVGTNVVILTSQEAAKKALRDVKDPMYQKFADILFESAWGYAQGTKLIELRKSVDTPVLSKLIRDVFEKSESIAELTDNLKDLAAYKAGQLGPLVDWITNNANDLQDAFETVQNIFFQLDDANTSGFYDANSNTAYVVADSIQPTTMLHEMFLHPFLIELEKTHPENFAELVAMAQDREDVVEYVNRVYGERNKIGARTYDHELIARVFDVAVNHYLDKESKRSKLSKLLHDFALFINKLFDKSLRKFTFEEAAEMNLGELAFDLIVHKKKYDVGVENNRAQAQVKSEEDFIEIIADEISEEETPVETEESTEEDYTVEQEELDNAIVELRSIEATINSINGRLESGQVTKSRELTALQTQRTRLLVDRRKLVERIEKLNELLPSKKETVPVQQPVTPVTQKVYDEDDFDYNDDETLIYNEKVPFEKYPLTLQYSLASVFGKLHGNLTKEDIDQINSNVRAGLSDYLLAIAEFNKNLDATKANKEANRLRAEEEQRAIKEKVVKEQLNDRDLLELLMNKAGITFDSAFLTDAEVSMLINNLKTPGSNTETLIHDVIELKAQVEQAAFEKLQAEEEARYEEEFQQLLDAEEEAAAKKKRKSSRKANTRNNLEALTNGTVEIEEEDSKGNFKKKSIKVGKALARFISIYKPKIFKLDSAEFAKEVRDFKREVSAEKKRIKETVKFDEKEILANSQLLKLFMQLERKGLLVPAIATEINKKLLEAKNPYRIRIINRKNYKPIGTIYSIEHGTKAQLKGTVSVPEYKRKDKVTENKLVNENEKDVLNREEEVRTPEDIDFYSTEAGQKLMEEELNYLEEYYKSKLYLIETGQFEGDVESLTASERLAYNKAVADGLYETVEEVQTEEEVTSDPFMDALNEMRAQVNPLLEKFTSEYFPANITRPSEAYESIQKIFTELNIDKASDFSFAASILLYLNEKPFTLTASQISTLRNKVIEKLGQGFYNSDATGQDVILKNGNRYKVISAIKNEVKLLNVETSALETLELSKFLSNISNVITDDTVIKNDTFESNLSEEESAVVENAFSNFFSKFDASVINNIKEDSMEDSIIELLKTQCK